MAGLGARAQPPAAGDRRGHGNRHGNRDDTRRAGSPRRRARRPGGDTGPGGRARGAARRRPAARRTGCRRARHGEDRSLRRRHRSRRRRHHARRAGRASRLRRSQQAVPRDAAQRGAHARRAVRAAGRGPAQPPVGVGGPARSARTRPRNRHPRRQAPGDRGQRRHRRPDTDLPPRQLRHRRQLRHHQQHRRAAGAVRVFPARAGRQGRRAAELVRAGRLHRPGHLQRNRQVQEGRVRRTRQARRRRLAQAAVHGQAGQRLDRDGRALLRQRLAPRREEVAARVLRAQARRGSLCRRRHHPGGDHRARPDRPRHDAAVRGPAGPGRDRQARQGPRPHRRLRHLHRARGAAVLAAAVAVRDHRQLGLGDRGDDHHRQERLLSAQPRERAVDGEDEGHRAEAEGAAGAVRRTTSSSCRSR